MKQHFGCTICGNCCHDLRVPLSFREAIAWSERGHTVEVLCEATWPSEPPPGDARAHFKRMVSFPATSGSLSVGIGVTIVASFNGPCPNRNDDLSCAIYERRPLVCRIYPAEIVPALPFDIARKACPSEAWQEDKPLFAKDGHYQDETLLSLISRSRALNVAEALLKERLCEQMGINAAALAHEGYMAHRRTTQQTLEALKIAAYQGTSGTTNTTGWTLVSNRKTTLAMLEENGALNAYFPARLSSDPWEQGIKYLGLQADDVNV